MEMEDDVTEHFRKKEAALAHALARERTALTEKEAALTRERAALAAKEAALARERAERAEKEALIAELAALKAHLQTGKK
jgi:hypothetical protein